MAERLDELLKKAGMKRKELAVALGVRPQTVSGWGEIVPKYAIAYLNGLVELKKCQDRNELLTTLVRGEVAK